MDNTINFARLSRVLLGFVALCILVLTVLIESNPGTRLPKRDYGVYAYIGQQIVRGKLPYRDAWETKPPAIFYVNALGIRLGRGTRWGIFAVQFAFLLTAASLAFGLMQKLWGVIPAWAGTFAWLYGLRATFDGGNLTEEYPLPFHFLSFILLYKLLENPKNRLVPILLGLAFGISVLFRPNNATLEVAVILAFALTLAFLRRYTEMLDGLIFITIGFITPITITAIYFWQAGLLSDLFEASILYNLFYTPLTRPPTSPLHQGFGIFGIGAWLALAGYLFLPARLKSSRSQPVFGVYLALLVAWPLAILLTDPGKRAFLHYFTNWLPSMALLIGLGIHLMLSVFSAKIQTVFPKLGLTFAGLAVIISAAVFTMSGHLAEYQTTLQKLIHPGDEGTETLSLTAMYVITHTKPGEPVLFWGAVPGENLMSRHPAPTAFTYYPLFVFSAYTDRYNKQFLRDLQQNKPVLIVDMDNHEALSLDPEKRAAQRRAGDGWEYLPANLDEVFSYIESHYYLEAVVWGRNVYRLYGTTK